MKATYGRPWLGLPRGQTLPDRIWRQRHRFMLLLGAAHVVLLPLFGIYMGEALLHVIFEGALIATFLAAALAVRSRTLQATFASMTLISSSAILVHFSGGYIEAHFHFFVSLAFITLYQEWVPFALTVAMTVIHHGTVGVLEPASVYNHPGAFAEPWKWALIHGLFVFAACTAYVVQWRLNEDARDEADTVLDAAGEAILRVDQKGSVLFANPAANQLFGRRRLIGQPITRLLRSCSGLQAGTKQTEQTELVGDNIPVEVVTSPLEKRGTADGHVVTVVDIRERIQAERERLRQRDEQLRRLRELDELKNAFINSVAHELRTPMTPLRVQARLLQRTSHELVTQRAAAILDRNLERLHRLVDDVLDVTRLQAGTLEPNPEDVGLHEVVGQAVQAIGPVAAEADIALRWSCPPEVTVRADAARMAQIVHNVLSHAVQRAVTSVTLSAAETDGQVKLWLRHDGATTPEELERLFQPFGPLQQGQADGSRGTGLGLYLSRALAELYGGRLEAAADPQGTLLTVSLPAASVQEPAEPLLVG